MAYMGDGGPGSIQVALEGKFTFVQDKFDLKSASDKKFVPKATVALENKICEKNTTMNCGEDSGKDSAFVTDADGLWLTFPRSFNI